MCTIHTRRVVHFVLHMRHKPTLKFGNEVFHLFLKNFDGGLNRAIDSDRSVLLVCSVSIYGIICTSRPALVMIYTGQENYFTSKWDGFLGSYRSFRTCISYEELSFGMELVWSMGSIFCSSHKSPHVQGVSQTKPKVFLFLWKTWNVKTFFTRANPPSIGLDWWFPKYETFIWYIWP